MPTIELPIEGMTCTSCAQRVEKVVARLSGINSAAVNFASETALVDLGKSGLNAQAIVSAIEEAGFRVPSETLRLRILNMSCASCEGRVRNALLAVPGVRSAYVNLATETAHIEVPRAAVSSQDLILALRVAGYEAERALDPANQRKLEAQSEQRRLRIELWGVIVPLLLCAPLVLPMLLMAGGLHWELPGSVQFVLAATVQFAFGASFYRGAWNALRAGTANMDSLVSLGTSAAFCLSLVNWSRGGALYFESAAVVISLVRLGKWLESRAKNSTRQAVQGLISLQPQVAHLCEGDSVVDVAAEAVARGARVLVRPGERVPVDGRIALGESELDESMLTGEVRPVTRSVGESVIGGSLNGSGLITVIATNVGGESVLSRVTAMVQNAQARKAPIQQQVDRVALVFVPIVLVIATLTLGLHFAWGSPLDSAILAAVAVLVVACPCALGLATPAALTVGMGVAARRGILIRDTDALQLAQNIDTVVFDKTGTLTDSRPAVELVIGENAIHWLSWAAAVQRGSEHPLGHAVVEYAKKIGAEDLPILNFKTFVGRGVQALVEGHMVCVGSSRFLSESGPKGGPIEQWSQQVEAAEARGLTAVWVFEAECVWGALLIGDQIRVSAKAVVEELHRGGAKVILLSGDRRAVAEHVATQLNLDNVLAEMLPDQKEEEVRRLRGQGHLVAMVGDGVNDAPALAVADVGIAMGSGSDIAIHSAGITLMRSDLRLVPEAIRISRATMQKVHQNLYWAFGYNVVLIPLAALGFLSPMMAGAAMALSSLSVIANALLLHRFQASPQLKA